MNEILNHAIESVLVSKAAFCRYITANDTGTTGAHQAGFYIPKNAYKIFFDEPGIKGENKDKHLNIKWQGDFVTQSRAIYYGKGTRNEYRLTRFGREFPFLEDSNVGDLLILCKIDDENYKGFVISSDDDIESFFSAVGISSLQTNQIIPKTETVSFEDSLSRAFDEYISDLSIEFPSTDAIAKTARDSFNRIRRVMIKDLKNRPDEILLNWLSSEFQLFKQLEIDRYKEIIKTPFGSVDSLIEFSNKILNRRKSRAGKSLEHHLCAMFDDWNLDYCAQCRTEGNSKPDFIFPSIEIYHEEHTGSERITFLAAKTTCKDRWRQILSEADKIPVKHLFTLQQGISENQLDEMKRSKVKLVVPDKHIASFPKKHLESIWNLKTFLLFVSAK